MLSPSKPIASTGSTLTCSRSASRRMRFGFRRPPPPTSQRAGALRDMLQRGRGRFDRERAERRRAVRVAQAFDAGRGGVEMIAVERFGRGAVEIGIAHQNRERRGVDAPACAQARRSSSNASPRLEKRKSSISALAGPVSKAMISPFGPKIGDVADPAPVEDHQRPLEASGHRRVIDRRERRAFASGRDIGRTKVRDDVDLERRRGARAVAELARQAGARPMQDGLAVQADERDALAGNGKPLEKRLDRRDMGVGHQALELELRRLGLAQVGDHRAQALRDRRRIGEGRRRARS